MSTWKPGTRVVKVNAATALLPIGTQATVIDDPTFPLRESSDSVVLVDGDSEPWGIDTRFWRRIDGSTDQSALEFVRALTTRVPA